MNCVKCVACEACVACEKYGVEQRISPQRRAPSMMIKGPPFKTVSGITVFVNRLCNLRCRYCFLFEYDRIQKGTQEMSLNIGQRSLIWLLASSLEKTPHFHYFGYEPLMSFNLMKELTEWGDRILQGTERSFKWGLTTNLILVTENVNDFLRRHNFYVLCSIDGTRESHDRNRVYPDGRGSWDDAIGGLRRLLTWEHTNPNGEKPGRTIRWTITPDTIDQIVPGTEFFLDMGVKNIAHEFVMETPWNGQALSSLEEELNKLIPIIIEYTRKDKILQFKPFGDGQRCLEDTRMGDRCGLAGGDIGLNVDGEFYLCHRFVDQPQHFVGTLWKGLDLKKIETLQQTWKSRLVSWDGTKDTCYDCIARMGCNGGCLAVNFDTTTNMFRPPRAFCDLQVVKARAARHLMKALEEKSLVKKYFERGGK